MMDGGDFWHVARGGGHERMLHHNAAAALRFRPIAPKPVVGGAFPGVVSPERAAVSSTAEKRVKRKYVRVRKDHENNSPRRKRSNVGKGLNSVMATTGESPANSGGSRSRSPAAEEEGVVESVVMVEHVTDASCMEEGVGGGLSGCTDAERMKSLETDTCPGFVSDGSLSKVEWVNEAYRRMVAGGGGRLPQVAVRLVSRTTSSGTHHQLGGCTDGSLFFTCHVRVQYCVNNSNNNNNNSYNNNNNNKNDNNKNNKEKMCWKIMPCDVWRLDSGGFAWKLDIKAALSLGL